ncbi:MAG: thermonuclease family protein [archaeon]
MKKKTLYWILGIFMFLVIVGALIPDDSEDKITTQTISEEDNQTKETQEETSSSWSCIDSDGGKDYYAKGYIDLGDGEKWWDECYDEQNPDYLGEYYCNSQGLVDSVNYKCPYGCNDRKCNSKQEESNLFTVTRIIDGDTIEISTGKRVRLICIDTPERGEYYYSEASNYLVDLILNEEVELVKDISETDRYGRLLRYIYLEDETFVNELIVYNGYGKAYPYSPDTSKCPIIQQAEQHAKTNNLGIWAEIKQETSSSSSDVICSYDAYNCGDFSTCSEVMRVFNVCNSDVHGLDRDSDGIPCESLCG